MNKKIKNAAWYPMAVAICIGVVLFVFLARFGVIRTAIGTFLGYFMPVIIGGIIAYIVNPLSRLLEKLFKFIKKEKTRRTVANVISFLIVVLFLVFAAVILIPQLVLSVQTFMKNWDGYVEALDATVKSWGITEDQLNVKKILSPSEDSATYVNLIEENLDSIISVSTVAGKGILNFVLGLILSIYLLSDKKNLKKGFKRLLKAVFGEQKYEGVKEFLLKCDTVCNRYVVFNLIDSLIVGFANALFMGIFGMQYIGLVSFFAAITNLIPTFGPVIGLVIGGFVLLMANPVHALIFLIFTLVLQAIDGYIIKPRLFGNSLGVSGLWIMIGVIVGGNMFGVIGILVSIPCVAIIDFVYKTYILPALEKKKQNN